MLESAVGVGNVRATVNVSYDAGSEENTDEIYDPSQVAPLSMHKTAQSTGQGAKKPPEIPGTVSNTPWRLRFRKAHDRERRTLPCLP